jgi:subtilisin family serine protease
MPVKGLDAGGGGYASDLAAALVYAVDNGARIINASWGAPAKSALIEAAANYVRASGGLLVAAAGNSNGPVAYPAALDGVVAVAATDEADAKADFSSFGPQVDLAAPGVDIRSTLPGGMYGTKSGTSMAAPHVAGVAALIAALHPFYTPAQLTAALRLATAAEVPADAAATQGQTLVRGSLAYKVRQVLPQPPDGAVHLLVLGKA